jgi:hypothetical protein
LEQRSDFRAGYPRAFRGSIGKIGSLSSMHSAITGGFRLYGAMKVTFGDPEGPIETATPEHDGSGNVIEISPGHIVSQLQMAKDSPTG